MGKQMKEMFAAVKDLVGAHDGDSDATSESDKSDAGEEEDGVDETIQSLKEIKKKYKKLKGEKKKKFKQHLAKSKATIELKNERIAALKAKIVEMGNDQSDSGSDSKSSDVSDSDDSD